MTGRMRGASSARCVGLGLAVVAMVAAAVPLQVVHAQDLVSGSVTVEGRGFPRDGLYPEQHRGYGGLVLEPELFVSTEDGRHAFTVAPFARLDSGDPERTHWDLRELYWRTYGDAWEFEAGLLRTFWGVTESQHLVDVVNQTDQVENPDGEDKLGQPALHGTWLADWGTIDVYVMPLFRERTFGGAEGRFRFPLLIDRDSAEVDGSLSVAARWFHFVGPLDIGVSGFYGTSREPRFVPVGPSDEPTGFAPLYEIVQQVGVDAQLILGGWLWKLEGITRSGQGDRLYVMTGGLEYTLGNLGNSGIDLGLIAEYSFDSRTADFDDPPFAVSIFADDLFLGSRLAVNDVQSTQLLGGAVLDVEFGTVSLLLEASRRVGESFTASFEIRSAANVDPEDPLYLFRRDTYAQLGVGFYY